MEQFHRKNAKAKIKLSMRLAFSKGVISEIDRSCLVGVGLKSKL